MKRKKIDSIIQLVKGKTHKFFIPKKCITSYRYCRDRKNFLKKNYKDIRYIIDNILLFMKTNKINTNINDFIYLQIILWLYVKNLNNIYEIKQWDYINILNNKFNNSLPYCLCMYKISNDNAIFLILNEGFKYSNKALLVSDLFSIIGNQKILFPNINILKYYKNIKCKKIIKTYVSKPYHDYVELNIKKILEDLYKFLEKCRINKIKKENICINIIGFSAGSAVSVILGVYLKLLHVNLYNNLNNNIIITTISEPDLKINEKDLFILLFKKNPIKKLIRIYNSKDKLIWKYGYFLKRFNHIKINNQSCISGYINNSIYIEYNVYNKKTSPLYNIIRKYNNINYILNSGNVFTYHNLLIIYDERYKKRISFYLSSSINKTKLISKKSNNN